MTGWKRGLAVLLVFLLMAGTAFAEEGEGLRPEFFAELGEMDLAEAVAAPEAPVEPEPMAAEPFVEEPPAAEAMDEPASVEIVPALAFPAALTLGVKECFALNGAEVFGAPVNYVSSEPKLVRVDEGGLLTAQKKGTAVVTALQGETPLASCTVTVLKAPGKLTFPDGDIVLSAGQERFYPASLPKNSAGAVSYASDNPGVLSVDGAGRLYGVAGGSATLTATAYNGKSASCAVRVLGGPAPSWVALDASALSLPVKGTARLSASFDAGCDAILSYSTSNKKIATVDDSGLVTARKAGQATITVTTHNGLTASCALQVFTAPKKVTLNAKKVTLLVNDGFQLAATLSKNSMSDILWTSDNPGVADVDGDGLVAALGPGSAVITAETLNGKKASCRVTVLDAGDGAAGALPVIGDNKGKLEIHFVSIGGVYDDVIILRDDAGAVLIDGGRERDEDRYGRTREIHEYLKAIGVDRLDYVIGSHLDENHVGAAAWLTDHMPVGAAYYPVDPATCPEMWCEDDARSALLHAMGNTDVRVARAGVTHFKLGGMEVCFVGTREEDFLDSPNSTSIINLVRYGQNRFLFAGDLANIGVEPNISHILEDAAKFGFSSLKVDMVKWPHHGNCNPSEYFWQLTDPRYVVVPNNGKSGSPSSGEARRMRHNAPNAELLKLSKYDTIVLVSDGSGIEVYFNVEPSRWRR